MALRKFYNKISGFTLLEFISILTIVAACFVLFKIAYNYRDNTIKTNITNEELALLNCAIEIYKSENGTYPVCNTQSVDENAGKLYVDISTKVTSIVANHKWNIVDNKFSDPWGNAYVYKYEPENSVSYVLFSMGPNGFIDENEIIDDMYSR